MPKLSMPSNFSTSNLVLVTIDLDENPFDVEVDGTLDSNYDISITNSVTTECQYLNIIFFDVEDQITLQPHNILINYKAKMPKAQMNLF